MAIAPLDNQVVFKKLFRDPQILQAFLYDVLQVRLDITADQIELEKQFHPVVSNIDFLMDILVDSPDHRLLIEIQRQRSGYNYDRFLYYHNAAMVELEPNYRKYQLEREVHTIVWLTQREQEERYQRSLMTTLLCTETEFGEQYTLYPHKLYFLNPFYVNDRTPDGVKDWMELVLESIANPTQPNVNYQRVEIARATKLIDDSELTPRERVLMKDEAEYQDTLDMWKERGRQEGRQESRQEQALLIARNLLDIADDQTISEKTGLPIEQVRQLRDE